MYKLPKQIQQKIYIYDNTYKLKFDNVIREIIKNNSSKDIIKLELVKEDAILLMAIAVILVYVYIVESCATSDIKTYNSIIYLPLHCNRNFISFWLML